MKTKVTARQSGSRVCCKWLLKCHYWNLTDFSSSNTSWNLINLDKWLVDIDCRPSEILGQILYKIIFFVKKSLSLTKKSTSKVSKITYRFGFLHPKTLDQFLIFNLSHLIPANIQVYKLILSHMPLSSIKGKDATEDTSYSAMLNIVEPVPPTEPIPSNSRNSVYHFQYNSGIPAISSYQFLGISGIPSDSGIEWSSCYPHPHTLTIASHSWTEFRELSRAGIGRNSYRFRNWAIIMPPSPSHPGYCIPFLNGIPGIESSRNWTEFLPIPELSDHHATLTLTPWLLHPIPERNSGNWVEQELDGIPTDSGIEWSSCHPHPQDFSNLINTFCYFINPKKLLLTINSIF